ncbi:MAG: S10 family peptidase [Gammaproteobacteria bacterium]
MKRTLTLVAFAGLIALTLPAWAANHTDSKGDTAHSATVPVPKERTVVTHGSVKVEGKTIHYTATAGTILLRNGKNKPVGSMFYVAYTKNGVRNPADRPVTFLYNGGPGASSNWLLMSGLGPYRVNLVNGKATPPAPYSIAPSHESILNDTYLVFIDAMGTGFSHVVGKGKGKNFWGVDEDVKSFGQFIERYLTQNDRWNSPLFLYGESYGTTRSAALAYYLQQQGIALNGVVLQSSILNYFDWTPGSDSKYVFTLPSFAAIAWYHDKLPGKKPASLPDFVQKAREFADGPFAQALRQGNALPKAKRDAMAQKLHQLTGLPVGYLERANLRVSSAEFRKELMLPERKHVGRYDARYTAADANAILARPAFDPSNQISSALNQGFLWYVHHVLKWKTNRSYVGLNFKAFKTWDWKHQPPGSHRRLPLPDVAPDLAAAMRMNPYLRVLSENGYFDLATPFHATEYDLSHVTLSPKLRKHITFAYFYSGHPIYINPKALKAMHAVLDTFYENTLAADKQSAAK